MSPSTFHRTWVRSIFQTSNEFMENVFITLLVTMKVDAVEITTHTINGRLRATNEMRVKKLPQSKREKKLSQIS